MHGTTQICTLHNLTRLLKLGVEMFQETTSNRMKPTESVNTGAWLADSQSRDLNNKFWLVVYLIRSVAETEILPRFDSPEWEPWPWSCWLGAVSTLGYYHSSCRHSSQTAGGGWFGDHCKAYYQSSREEEMWQKYMEYCWFSVCLSHFSLYCLSFSHYIISNCHSLSLHIAQLQCRLISRLQQIERAVIFADPETMAT